MQIHSREKSDNTFCQVITSVSFKLSSLKILKIQPGLHGCVDNACGEVEQLRRPTLCTFPSTWISSLISSTLGQSNGGVGRGRDIWVKRCISTRFGLCVCWNLKRELVLKLSDDQGFQLVGNPTCHTQPCQASRFLLAAATFHVATSKLVNQAT